MFIVMNHINKNFWKLSYNWEIALTNILLKCKSRKKNGGQ